MSVFCAGQGSREPVQLIASQLSGTSVSSRHSGPEETSAGPLVNVLFSSSFTTRPVMFVSRESWASLEEAGNGRMGRRGLSRSDLDQCWSLRRSVPAGPGS